MTTATQSTFIDSRFIDDVIASATDCDHHCAQTIARKLRTLVLAQSREPTEFRQIISDSLAIISSCAEMYSRAKQSLDPNVSSSRERNIIILATIIGEIALDHLRGSTNHPATYFDKIYTMNVIHWTLAYIPINFARDDIIIADTYQFLEEILTIFGTSIFRAKQDSRDHLRASCEACLARQVLTEASSREMIRDTLHWAKSPRIHRRQRHIANMQTICQQDFDYIYEIYIQACLCRELMTAQH